MKLTRQRKIYLAVLGVGLGGLGVDRFVLDHDTPQAASASVAPTSDAVPAASRAVPVAVAEPTLHAVPIAHQLAMLAAESGPGAGAAVDAFSPSAEWLAADAPLVAAPAAPADGAPRLTASELFAREHHLSGVMVYAGGGSAIIDGQAVAVGQTIGGYRLAEVSQRRIVLRSTTDERIDVTLVSPISATQK